MIKFFNVNNQETRTAETEPMLSAFWNSSDRGPNASRGQDFGWRLAAETVVELNRIKKDPTIRSQIAQNALMAPDEVDDVLFIKYISDQGGDSTGMTVTKDAFAKQYEDEIRKLERFAEQELAERNVVKSKGDNIKK